MSATTIAVQSEAHFIADNCPPDTDFIFVRP